MLAAVAILALLGVAGSLHWASRPRNLTALLLDRAGMALGLEITTSGANEYRFSGTPRLVLRDVVARQPGSSDPVLTAARVEVELPWSTLRARGADLTVEHIRLDAPRLDLEALQRWQATRPDAGPARIPTLRSGMTITRGVLLARGWRLDALDVSLPSLHAQRPVRAQARGRAVAGTVRMLFDLALRMDRPAATAGIAASGPVTVETPDWQLPMRMRLSGRLHAGDDGIGLDAMRFGAPMRYVGGRSPYPFTLGLAGKLRMREGGVALDPLGIAVRGEGVVPTLRARGAIRWRETLELGLDGMLERWPEAWPGLPPPLNRSAAPLPFVLRYGGPVNLSGNTHLRLQHGVSSADMRLTLPLVLQWIDTHERGSPLPPLTGHASAPRLDLDGAVLEGVEMEIDAEQAGPAP